MLPVLNLVDVWRGVSKKIVVVAFGYQTLFALSIVAFAAIFVKLWDLWASWDIPGIVATWHISDTIGVGWLNGQMMMLMGYVLSLDRFAVVYNACLDFFADAAQSLSFVCTTVVLAVGTLVATKWLRRITEDWLQL